MHTLGCPQQSQDPLETPAPEGPESRTAERGAEVETDDDSGWGGWSTLALDGLVALMKVVVHLVRLEICPSREIAVRFRDNGHATGGEALNELKIFNVQINRRLHLHRCGVAEELTVITCFLRGNGDGQRSYDH